MIKAGFDEATFQSEGKRLYPRRPKPSHLPDNELFIVDTLPDGTQSYSTSFPDVEGYPAAANSPGQETDDEVDFILQQQAAVMASLPPFLPSQAPNEVDQPPTPTEEQLFGLFPADCVDPDHP